MKDKDVKREIQSEMNTEKQYQEGHISGRSEVLEKNGMTSK